MTIHRVTYSSSTRSISTTLNSMSGTLRARLQMTEAWTWKVTAYFTRENYWFPNKNSWKEKKLVKDNGSVDSLVFLSVSLSSRPCQNSSLLPFHEAQAWSAAALHALYLNIATKLDLLPSQKRVTEEIWQAYFGSLWDAYIDNSVAKWFKNSNGCQENRPRWPFF